MRLAAFILVSPLCVICTGCVGSAASPIALERTIDMNGRAVAVQIALQPEHRGLAQRYLDAAEAAVRGVATWAPIDGPLRLDDPPFHGGVAVPGVVALPRTPWWSTKTAMAPELAVARAVTTHALATAMDRRRLPVWFMNGLVEYLTPQIVIGLFSRENLSPGFATLEARHFGGFVPRFIRARLLPESDVDPIRAFRARRDVDPSGTDVEAMTGKTVAVFATLDHWLGTPVFNSVISGFIKQYRTQPPTIADFVRTASDVSGQDLSWLLVQAFGAPTVFDYGVESLSSAPAADGQFETHVTMARYGDGLFTGSAAARSGPFESGKAVALVVAFADGSRINETWDGRDRRKALTYRSPTAAVEAVVDPDRVLALDLNRTNNGITLAPATGTASLRWSARWLAWMENALLTYAALV